MQADGVTDDNRLGPSHEDSGRSIEAQAKSSGVGRTRLSALAYFVVFDHAVGNAGFRLVDFDRVDSVEATTRVRNTAGLGDQHVIQTQRTGRSGDDTTPVTSFRNRLVQ